MNHQDWEPVILTKKHKPVVTNEQQIAKENAIKISKLESEDFVPDKPNTNYAKFLQKARLQNKLSQKDLATKLHVPSKTVQLWESGKQIIPGNQIGNLNRTLKVNFKKNQLIL